jgi:hypothetical protein
MPQQKKVANKIAMPSPFSGRKDDLVERVMESIKTLNKKEEEIKK